MKQLLLLLVPVLVLSCRTEIPLVYDAENPAAVFEIPDWNPEGLEEPVSMLPDPQVFADGSRVKHFRDWPARRAEIATQLQFYELGVKPIPPKVLARMDGDTLRVDVTVGKETLSLSAVIHYPEGEGPFPLLIGASFITLPPALLADRPVATMNFNERQVTNYGQFGPRDDRGAYAFDRLFPDLTDNGAYIEWAWGFSRLLDGLQQLGPDVTRIDTRHIGVTGCSYAGKMALYCGAFDERVALTIAQEPGGGGAAAWRKSHELTLAGRNVEDLDKTDYHWFQESQREQFHGDSVYRLPYDQHELCALVCPRALLLLGNPDYEWLADRAMIPSAEAARRVWDAFGISDRMGWSVVDGHGHCQLPPSQFPEVQAFIDRFLLGRDADTSDVRIVKMKQQ